MIIAAAGLVGTSLVANYAVPMVLRVCRCRSIGPSRVLALTYDDGPGNGLTPQLLDLLGDWDAKATFFSLGRAAVRAGDILDRAVAEGHEIGCHSRDHFHAWKTWPWRAPLDAAGGFASLARWLPKRPLYRPPYGKMTLGTWAVVWRHRGLVYWWDHDGGDTAPVLPDPTQTAERIVRAGWGVVLMHDFHHSAERAAFVLEMTKLLLQIAEREEIRCGTLSDISVGGGRVPRCK